MTVPQVPGLLWNGKWIPPVRDYGGDTPTLEQLLLKYGDVIFPGHFIAPFDLILSMDPEEDQTVADLVLVSKEYVAWHLLFIAPHGVTDKDILRAQLETAVLSPYGNREARELKRQIKDLDEERMHALVIDGPGFVIVTDDPKHRWDEDFEGLQVGIMIVEPFQLDAEFVFRINGRNPAVYPLEVCAFCDDNPKYPGSLIVRWVDFDQPAPIGLIKLKYRNGTTNWSLSDQGSTLLLLPEGGSSPLLEPPPFELIKTLDGEIGIQRRIVEA